MVAHDSTGRSQFPATGRPQVTGPQQGVFSDPVRFKGLTMVHWYSDIARVFHLTFTVTKRSARILH